MHREEFIARRFKLRELRTLQAVVHHGSMAKAAVSLAITQSAISKSIAEMERTLGVALLERTSRGVEPTAYGAIMLKQGVAMFDELRQAVKEIEFLSDPTSGELRVGTTEPMMIVVSAVIDRLSRRYPRLTFDVMGADTTMLLAQLRHREVDLLVSRIGDPVDDDLDVETLFDDQLVVVAGKGNAWIGKRKVVLDDLMRERWILPPPDTFLRPYIEGAFRARGLDLPTATIIGRSAHLRNNLLARANFLTIFPHAMMRLGGWHPSIRSLNVDLPTTRRPVALITLRKRSHNPATRLFIDEARRVAKPLR